MNKLKQNKRIKRTTHLKNEFVLTHTRSHIHTYITYVCVRVHVEFVFLSETQFFFGTCCLFDCRCYLKTYALFFISSQGHKAAIIREF